jgi:dTDP-4-dehydrorhamnose 3,5-epimerase
MPAKTIDGIRVKQLRVIPYERGRLMEMLRRDDEIFVGFVQTYMTTMYPRRAS